MSDLADYQRLINEQTQLNNSWSAEQAQKQMDFQERMSSTAHQREIADLKAAGLNPVLSANSGASSPTGAMASGTDANISAIANVAVSLANAESARAQAASYNSMRASDLNGIAGILQLLGVNVPRGSLGAAATAINGLAKMNTTKVANSLDFAGSWLASLLGNRSPRSGTSAAKAKDYRTRTGVSSTLKGLQVFSNAAKSLISRLRQTK